MQRNMLQVSRPGEMHQTHHKFGQLHRQCTCCENQWEAGWPKLKQKSVSYLATWQHGNVKLMPRNARHIPGPDARQWCNSGSATSLHSANQSSQAFSPPLRVSTFTFSLFFSNKKPSPKTLSWSEWTSNQWPEDYFHVAGCWPSGGGRATTCKYDA